MMVGENENTRYPQEAEETEAAEGAMVADASAWKRATDALTSRPRFSVRFLIGAGFGLVFLFAVTANLLWIASIYRMEEKLHWLEVADKYLYEIQQARRFEKNHFLYGTGLGEALEHAHRARHLLVANAEGLREEVGWAFEDIVRPAEQYEKMLEAIYQAPTAEGEPGSAAQAKSDEVKIRRHGAVMVAAAVDLVSRERKTVEAMFERAKRQPIYSLIPLLALMLYLSHFLAMRIVRPLSRFQGYAQRIARGDFTPITPARRYRDEFTELGMAVNHMLSELQQHEKLLVESHKLRAVGTLTAGVAHELNNPINNILLTAHMLKEDFPDLTDDERLEMLDDIISQSERSNRIVHQLLDFARESEAKTQPLDIGNLVEETVRLAQNQIRLAGVRLETKIAPNLPRVHGDYQQLSQVFLNLLLNALEATTTDGHIVLTASAMTRSPYLRVNVTDDGMGIPNHQLSSIFDPFFSTKLRGTESARGGGVGLGLSVSQGIVAKHGGRIEVLSEEGKGSTFSVLLPVTTIPAEFVSSFEKEAKEAGGQSDNSNSHE